MLHPAIAQRRSPRAFDPFHRLSVDDVTALLEAARWAPSAMNRQPWAFLVGHRGDGVFKGIAETLAGGNQVWASAASSFIVAFIDNGDADAGTDPARAYELGLAVGQLGIQAQSMGLITHQMGGFDREQLCREFAVPGHLRPAAVIAVGAQGDAADLPRDLREREVAPRARREIEELLFDAPGQLER